MAVSRLCHSGKDNTVNADLNLGVGNKLLQEASLCIARYDDNTSISLKTRRDKTSVLVDREMPWVVAAGWEPLNR